MRKILLNIEEIIVVTMLLSLSTSVCGLSTLTARISRNVFINRYRSVLVGGRGEGVILGHKMSTSETTESASASPAVTETEKEENKSTKKKRVLSGVQPTGSLHLGNYLGAIRQWVTFQDESSSKGDENFFCVVDLHAITMPHNPEELKENTLSSAALYLAAGIDPSKSRVFVQSHVSAHSELTWLLSCMTPINWLERMIQYKEKK